MRLRVSSDWRLSTAAHLTTQISCLQISWNRRATMTMTSCRTQPPAKRRSVSTSRDRFTCSSSTIDVVTTSPAMTSRHPSRCTSRIKVAFWCSWTCRLMCVWCWFWICRIYPYLVINRIFINTLNKIDVIAVSIGVCCFRAAQGVCKDQLRHAHRTW